MTTSIKVISNLTNSLKSIIGKPDDIIHAERVKPKERDFIDDGVEEVKEREITMAEVRGHWANDDCWMVIKDDVYNITSFIQQHPGGEELLLEYGGTDATAPFTEMGHSADAVAMLSVFKIGRLAKAERTIHTPSSVFDRS